ncbi:isoleucine-tRNA ligase [Balamuthia mandrillaris]
MWKGLSAVSFVGRSAAPPAKASSVWKLSRPSAGTSPVVLGTASTLRFGGVGHCGFSRRFLATATTASAKDDPAAAPAADAAHSFAHTLNLPKSSFAMRPNWSNLEKELEPELTSSLYEWQEKAKARAPAFVLHDGPPYANGKLHMGHALNKILKDFVVRYKLLRGYRVSFVPGWDCHGLPIEQKALEKSKKPRSEMSPTEIRELARACADDAIRSQNTDFQSWGVMGDWNKPYTTKDRSYEASQLGLFLELYKKGFVYRSLKPVLWSPSSRTALAEAEVEYPENHVSRSLYVAFPLKAVSTSHHLLQNYPSLSALIWTTTPWTIPANMAVCVHPEVKYCVAKTGSGTNDVTNGLSEERFYLIAEERLAFMEEKLGCKLEVMETMPGETLIGSTYIHPLDGRVLPVLAGHHVTTQSGTGLVHTAPAHGMDDYLVCKEHGILPSCFVDEDGKFTAEAGPFCGLEVLTTGNKAVIEALKAQSAVLKEENYQHKYPYDWRTKLPVILRATEQWFIGLQDVVGPALTSLQNVEMIPSNARTRLESFLQGRLEWCISRQRVWGVPIPVFYDSETGEPLLTEESIRHVQEMVKQHGTDCWWNLSTEELLAPVYRNNGKQYIKGMDTMDVWLDSGASWNSVLKERNIPFPADVYLEGSDQHRGWFQSSLITSVAVSGDAPYKNLITHGFVLDEKGKKMAKSLGNVIEPVAIIKGHKTIPASGVDVLRMWVASSDYTRDILIGPSVLVQVRESLKKIRNTARFLLGNLNGFDESNPVPYHDLSSLDKYFLHRLYQFSQLAKQDYDSFHFSKVYSSLINFASVDMSAFYLDIIKDRLYSESTNGLKRRSCQTVMHSALRILNSTLAPLACFTAQDIHRHALAIGLFQKQEQQEGETATDNVFKMGWAEPEPHWHDPQLDRTWQLIQKTRSEVYKVLETARSDKMIGSFLDAAVEIVLPSTTSELRSSLTSISEEELNDVLVTSKTRLMLMPHQEEEEQATESKRATTQVDGVPVTIRVYKPAVTHKCPRCWKRTSLNVDVLCPRCETVVHP